MLTWSSLRYIYDTQFMDVHPWININNSTSQVSTFLPWMPPLIASEHCVLLYNKVFKHIGVEITT